MRSYDSKDKSIKERDFMNNGYVLGMLIFIVISFITYLFGLLKIFPLYLAATLLYFSIFIFLLYINYRNKFNGFKK